jgi:group I intron endonuclease
MAVIYQITNMITGDFYIGSAQSFARRQWQHRYALKRGDHKNPHMQASWNKYGEDAFVFEILEEVSDESDILEIENIYLHECVGRVDCFNVNRDAQLPRLGQTHSEESRKKISSSRKGKAGGEDHYRYGQTLSDEVRKKISRTQKGRPSPMKGRKMSEQGRVNVAAAVKRGEESHFYGKRPTNADDMQRAILVRYPDGKVEEYASLTYIRDTFGVGIATIIRACKSKKRIQKGVFAGCDLRYADEGLEENTIPAEPEIPDEYAHLPRTRSEAKATGSTHYFTGLPCKHGHTAPRKTKGSCVACIAAESK